MLRLSPAVSTVRLAVRAALEGLKSTAAFGPKIDGGAVDLGNAVDVNPSSALVLTACSGGSDSLALAAAAVFVAPRVGLVTVDHQLQEGSGERASAVVDWASSAGFDPAEAITVAVGTAGGPEAAARDARYGALVEAAKKYGAACVLLGHTEDDQAETVLLALARGGGPRGVAGMPSVRVVDGVTFLRPLLGVSRRTCREACVAQGLLAWDDPHNVDSSYARARVRAEVMPRLVKTLGADVVANLARTASLVAADNNYLDELAVVAFGQCMGDGGLEVAGVAALPIAIRSRVLRAWAISLGVPGAALSHRHIAALEALVTAYHGQGVADLPGRVSVARRGKWLSGSRR